MRANFIRADARNSLGNEFLAGHFFELSLAGFNFFAESQALERAAEKVGVKAIFVAVP